MSPPMPSDFSKKKRALLSCALAASLFAMSSGDFLSTASSASFPFIPMVEAVATNATYDYGIYVAEYLNFFPPNTPYYNYAQAMDACERQGPGWTIAAVPTNEAAKFLTSKFYMQEMWVGGDQLVKADEWRWSAGRLKGLQFSQGATTLTYNYNPVGAAMSTMKMSYWGAGEPNNWMNSERCMTFISTLPSANDLNCGNTRGYYMCERSACRFGTDCSAIGTVPLADGGMQGDYYPNCTCTCKPGFTGPRCDIVRYNHPHGLYVSEYTLTCPYPMSPSRAVKEGCSNRGPGWQLASFPYRGAYEAAFVMLKPDYHTSYIGARTAAGLTEADAKKWQWTNGRLANSTLLTTPYAPAAATCESYAYQPFGGSVFAVIPPDCSSFAAGQPGPSAADGNGNALRRMAITTGDPTEGSWSASSESSNTTQCAACERSPCTFTADCIQANTVEMKGDYFPNCTCTCKPGFGGKHCETAIIDNGAYVSEFTVACSADVTDRSISASSAASLCVSRGSGYGLASVPSAAVANKLLKAVGSFVPAWIGAGSDGNGEWSWNAGRLAKSKGGSTFYRADTCRSITFTPFAHSIPSTTFGANCLWEAGQPLAASASTNKCARIRAVDADLVVDARDCDDTSGQMCAVCERSACQLGVDCSVAGTLKMSGDYFPSCTCKCKKGFGGPKCDVTATASVSASASLARTASVQPPETKTVVVHTRTATETSADTITASLPITASTQPAATSSRSVVHSATQSAHLSLTPSIQPPATPSLSAPHSSSQSPSLMDSQSHTFSNDIPATRSFSMQYVSSAPPSRAASSSSTVLFMSALFAVIFAIFFV